MQLPAFFNGTGTNITMHYANIISSQYTAQSAPDSMGTGQPASLYVCRCVQVVDNCCSDLCDLNNLYSIMFGVTVNKQSSQKSRL